MIPLNLAAAITAAIASGIPAMETAKMTQHLQDQGITATPEQISATAAVYYRSGEKHPARLADLAAHELARRQANGTLTEMDPAALAALADKPSGFKLLGHSTADTERMP